MANSLIKMLETRMYAANRKVRAAPYAATTPEWQKLLTEAKYAAMEYKIALHNASTKEDE